MKILFKVLKKIILCCFILYSYNYIACNFNLLIPINVINVIIIFVLGPAGLCGLSFFKYLIL